MSQAKQCRRAHLPMMSQQGLQVLHWLDLDGWLIASMEELHHTYGGWAACFTYRAGPQLSGGQLMEPRSTSDQMVSLIEGLLTDAGWQVTAPGADQKGSAREADLLDRLTDALGLVSYLTTALDRAHGDWQALQAEQHALQVERDALDADLKNALVFSADSVQAAYLEGWISRSAKADDLHTMTSRQAWICSHSKRRDLEAALKRINSRPLECSMERISSSGSGADQ